MGPLILASKLAVEAVEGAKIENRKLSESHLLQRTHATVPSLCRILSIATPWRALLLVGAALFVAWLLYPTPRDVRRGAAVTEIVFWTPHGNIGDKLRVGVEAFERRHPQYRVVMGTATVRDATGDPTRFLLGVAGGVPPDLIYFDRFAVVEWASRGAFEDLSPYLAADADREDAIHERDFYRPAWNEARYRGKLYAIPNSVDTRALYYQSNALIRAGFVYDASDPLVRSGQAAAGQARPPLTWEQLCRKRIDARGRATQEGVVRLEAWTRGPAINEDLPPDHPLTLARSGVRGGDVVVLVRGQRVFRGRVAEVLGPDAVQIDPDRDQPPGRSAIPHHFAGESCRIKIFDQDSYVARLTRFDEQTGTLKSVGFLPFFGNSWLYMFGWLNGARFMSEDGSQCLLDSPRIVEALQFVTDVYDAQGGVTRTSAFQMNAGSGALDPFLTGRIAMRIDSNGFLGTISAYKPDLEFGVEPAPIPERRRGDGHPSVGWMGGWAYAIPSTAKQKQGAWDLLRWLCSIQANQIMTEFQASLSRARGQNFFPSLHPDRRVMRWLDTTYIQDNPAMRQGIRKAFHQFVDLLPTSKFRPVTPVGQRLWTEHARATDSAVEHQKQPDEALSAGRRRTQEALDRILHPPAGPNVPWFALIASYVACVAIMLLVVIAWRMWRTHTHATRGRAWLAGYICVSPWLLGFIVFGGGPIVFSLVISMCHYDVLNPAKFVALSNYTQLLGFHESATLRKTVANDPLFWRSLSNTAFMVIGVPLSIVAGLALALLLNTKIRGMAAFRTLYYLPVVVPAVAAFLLWIWVFDPLRGFLNMILRAMGITDPPHWLQEPTWAKPALILMGLWTVGGGMIIWLAGLQEIPHTLYEAARIDGANRWQQFRRITLPLLTPYIFFNMIMGMIGVFQMFESAYVMTDGGPADATLFYAYKLFNEAFRYLNLGTASAMAWILFVVVLLITLLQLWLGRKWVHYER